MRGGASGTLDVTWKVGNKALRDGMFEYLSDMEDRGYDTTEATDMVYEKLKAHAEEAGFRNVDVVKSLDEVDVEFDGGQAAPGQLSFSLTLKNDNGTSKNLAVVGTFSLKQAGGKKGKKTRARRRY